MNPKVLIACPVSEYKDYILYKWLDYVKNSLTYDNYEIFISDNSPNYQHHLHLRKLETKGNKGLTVGRIKNEGENRFYMARSSEQCRKYAVDNGFDYWFSLECDIIPPPDIIELLLAHNKQVVAAPYFIGDVHNRTLMLQGIYEILPKNYKSLTLPIHVSFLMLDGLLKRTYAAGMGCCLIARKAFEKITMRVEQNNEGHADSFFYMDCYMQGIQILVDTNLIVKHFNSPEIWTRINNK